MQAARASYFIMQLWLERFPWELIPINYRWIPVSCYHKPSTYINNLEDKQAVIPYTINTTEIYLNKSAILLSDNTDNACYSTRGNYSGNIKILLLSFSLKRI